MGTISVYVRTMVKSNILFIFFVTGRSQLNEWWQSREKRQLFIRVCNMLGICKRLCYKKAHPITIKFE